MEYRDYYKILGLERTASADQVKTAYRRLARKYHPDVSKEKNAEERFKEVQEAYEVLKDPEKRAAYDQLGSEWQSGQQFRPPPDWGSGYEFSGGAERGGPRRRSYRASGGEGEYAQEDFSDFFSSLFGGRDALRRRPARAPPAIITPASTSASRRPSAARRARSSCAVPRSSPTAP